MRHLQLFENFEPAREVKNPRGGIRGIVKNIFGMENKEDRESLNKIKNVLKPSNKQFVEHIRKIGPHAITCMIIGRGLTVDADPANPSIMYHGKRLDLDKIDSEAEFLYDILSDRL